MRKATALVLLVLFSSSACSLRAPMKRFSTQEEAGTVHVAVQSIALFDDAYTVLQRGQRTASRHRAQVGDTLGDLGEIDVKRGRDRDCRQHIAELGAAGQRHGQ